jgi:hypothetical protein
MRGKKESFLLIAFLVVFFAVSLLINFFHTEKTIFHKDNCPACNFLNSTFATGQINFFQIPELFFIDIIKTSLSFHLKETFLISSCGRSPPQS